MSFSIEWPVMPTLGPVSIHSVGNQNYSTGFDVQYQGPKGRVTLYVNHYLTDDMRLVFRHREDGQYRHSPGYRLPGDAFEAEQAIAQFVAADGLIDRPAGRHTTRANVRSSIWGAATVALSENDEVIKDIRSGLNFLRNDKRREEPLGFGLTFGEFADCELEERIERRLALQTVLDTLRRFRGAEKDEVLSAIARPDLRLELSGFEVKPIKPASQVLRDRGSLSEGGRVIFAQAWGHRNQRRYAEHLTLSLSVPSSDPLGFGEPVKAEAVKDDDLLIVISKVPLKLMKRDMIAFQAIQANPDIIFLDSNGNIEGKLKDFTPEMFVDQRPTLTI